MAERTEGLVHSPVEHHHSSESFHGWGLSIVQDSVVQNLESYSREKVAEEVLGSADFWVWMSGRRNSHENNQETDPGASDSDFVVAGLSILLVLEESFVLVKVN